MTTTLFPSPFYGRGATFANPLARHLARGGISKADDLTQPNTYVAHFIGPERVDFAMRSLSESRKRALRAWLSQGDYEVTFSPCALQGSKPEDVVLTITQRD